MAFELTDPVPTTIGLIRIVLLDGDGSNPSRSINGRIDIHDQDGVFLRKWEGDVKPHLTASQLNGLIAFLDAMRAKAEAELLPGGG